ncbi:MAG: adenylate/guanylate cyclase domain-containing protein [Myxococcales bacterium]|nr:adenylate/guanylate cyclase domain-containing protein [Myxococcales bacterium]
MKPVVFEREVVCRASPAELWPRFADTERLNRHIGSAALEVTPLDDGALARFVIATQIGSIKVRYAEEPFSWQHASFFSFKRTMESGLAASLYVRYDLEPRDGATLVRARFEATPRYSFARPIIRLLTRQNIERLVRFVKETDRVIAEKADVELLRSPCDRQALHHALRELDGTHDAPLVEKLTTFLETAPDMELVRVRPYELADRWGAPRRAVLRLFLGAVRAGVLSLEWAILCPSCRTGSQLLPSLAELTAQGHCHACDLRFGLDLDRAVEAVFRPQKRIRAVDARPFCIGGPMLTPHVVAQAPLPAGGAAELRVPDEPGRYRVFARGGATAVVDVEPQGRASAEIKVLGSGLAPLQLSLSPGATIHVVGDDAPRHVKLERRDWSFPVATAHQVSLLPEFRSHFGKEALRPELALSVGRVAILFSDLCNSTALYSRVGDAVAFGVVTDCLRFGSAIVERHRGLVVKTMGDAIMGAFEQPGDAVAAASAMLNEWEQLTREQPHARALDLKIGVAVGTCMVMSANGMLDYFGQTVNRAARFQDLAGARQLVVPAELWAASGPRELTILESFSTPVKGIDAPLDLVRATPIAPRS